MTRRSIIGVVTASAFVVCLACFATRLVAEPISGEVPAPAAKAPPQSQEVKDAAELFKKGDYEGALKLLKEAVKKNADLPPAQIIMAQWFYQANAPVGVRAMLEQAVVAAPADPQAYVMMANIALSEGRTTEAKLLYEKADAVANAWNGNPKRKETLLPQIQSGLAQTYAVSEDWAGEQKHLENWLKLDPKSAEALQRLGHCLFMQKNNTGALEKLKEAAKIEPGLLTPEAILARWFAQSGNQKDATTWMIAALKVAPKDAKTRVTAASWAFETGQLDEAKKQADAALRLDPKSTEAMNIRGLIAYFQKDYPRAQAYFQSALDSAPSELKFGVSNNLALALIEQNDEQKKAYAFDLASKNVSKFPRRADALATLGWVLYKRGQLDEAERALATVAKGGTISPDGAYYLACILKDRGQDAMAKRWIESALRTTAPFQHRDEAKALLAKLAESPTTKKSGS